CVKIYQGLWVLYDLFWLIIKRLKDLEREKDSLWCGLEVLERARLWYHQRLEENTARRMYLRYWRGGYDRAPWIWGLTVYFIADCGQGNQRPKGFFLHPSFCTNTQESCWENRLIKEADIPVSTPIV
uniref:Uncharacterized protein n=1 Tax=Myripristis murdjan TaxID=586833 RepID=A0A667ZMQ0_9TELE